MNDEWFQDGADRSSRSWSYGDDSDWGSDIGDDERDPDPWSD